MKMPELLSPAGSLEKLKTAINYGANAVYAGGQKFGLRAAAENFSLDELVEGVEFAHKKNALVYVALNSFFVDKDILELNEFVKFLSEINVDAVIVSDLGGIETVKSAAPNLAIHLSTQSSCLNSYSGLFWKKVGVKRLILGREVTILEAKKIKEATNLEIELFIQGSMCMSYSGNCVISNFTSGRDSNRGGCKHSCRFEYTLERNGEEKKLYFMSSKDLNGIQLLPQFIEHGIDSIKVEGRMKSNLYAAVVSKVYGTGLKLLKDSANISDLESQLNYFARELEKLPHRDYHTGSLESSSVLTSSTNYDEREEKNKKEYAQTGTIIEVLKDELVIEVKNAFNLGDTLEIIPFNGKNIVIKIDKMVNLLNMPINRTKPNTLVKIPYSVNVQKGNIIRPFKEL